MNKNETNYRICEGARMQKKHGPAKYRKCEIQDQNDAPHMRTKEATHHEKRSQKGGTTY